MTGMLENVGYLVQQMYPMSQIVLPSFVEYLIGKNSSDIDPESTNSQDSLAIRELLENDALIKSSPATFLSQFLSGKDLTEKVLEEEDPNTKIFSGDTGDKIIFD